jgi:putative SOS response-associated peptidase YedK
MGIDSILGEGSKDRLPDHQWRAETVDKAPSYRQAFKKRRCLIPADGFYEWRKTAKPKLPFAIAMKDGRPFTFAGLWENWKDPESNLENGCALARLSQASLMSSSRRSIPVCR